MLIVVIFLLVGFFLLWIALNLISKRQMKILRRAEEAEILGDFQKSEQLLLEVLPKIEKFFGPCKESASALNNLATLYILTGRYTEAEHFCQRALAIYLKDLGTNHEYSISGQMNIAIVYHTIGRYAEAEELQQRVLVATEKTFGLEHLLTANSLCNLANIFHDTGRYVDAEIFYKRSLAINEKICGTEHPKTATVLNNLACLYDAIGRYNEAEEVHKRALAIREKILGTVHPDTANSLNNLASIYLSNRHYADAEKLYQRSIEINEKCFGINHPSTALSLHNLALIYEVSGRYSDSEKFYKRSLAIREGIFGPDHSESASSLKNLADVYQSTGRLNAAILLKKRAVNAIQKVRKDIFGIGNNVLSSFDNTIEEYYKTLSESLIKASRFGEAEYVMCMFKEKEQFEMIRRDLQIDIVTRTISYNDAEAPLVEYFDKIGSSLFALCKKEQEFKRIIGSAKLKEKKSYNIFNRLHLNGEENLYYSYITKESETVKKQSITMNKEFIDFLDNLHEALPPREVTQIDQDSYKLINMTDADANTVAIFTVTAEESFHTVMVTPHGRKAFSADHKATDIATKVLKFRELLKYPENLAYLNLSKELYDIIIRPMEEEFLSGEYTTILWMLNGVLRLLPLAALHDGKQFVLEKFRNVCITTCSTIGQQSHESWNGLGLGVTREHHGHSPLPAVKEELEGIISMDHATGIMPGDILLDEAFTRDAMESHLEEGYKAVHIASHFELNPANETMSYLLLGDGSTIRMDELRSIPRLFKGVDLVAFSACSTGLGTASTRGREVDGIGYLGEMQGAKTVMATLWPVEDKSTSMLMREFYRLREAGMTKAESLRQAQLNLLNGVLISEEGHDFTHPYFWAPFILIGNGG